jgi:hypothetical protein
MVAVVCRRSYELYRDRAPFEAHESTAHTRRFLTEREALLENTEVDFLTSAGGKILSAVGPDSIDG